MTRLHQALAEAVRNGVRGIHVGLPGKLVKYDARRGRAHVKPQIQAPDGIGAVKPLPIITGVPVIMPGGQQAALYLPPKIGDTGWLAFADRSLEEWLTSGGDAKPADPRAFDLTDAVFFPGLRTFSDGSLAEEADAAVLRNGAAKLKLRGGKVAIGNPEAVPIPVTPPISGPAFTGPVELLALFDALLDQLSNPTLVTGSATINPAFTNAVGQIRQNLGKILGSL